MEEVWKSQHCNRSGRFPLASGDGAWNTPALSILLTRKATIGLSEWAIYRAMKSAFLDILDMTRFERAVGDKVTTPERTAFANSFLPSSHRTSKICQMPSAPAGRSLRNSGWISLSGLGDNPLKAAMFGLVDLSLLRVTRSAFCRASGWASCEIQSKVNSQVVMDKKKHLFEQSCQGIRNRACIGLGGPGRQSSSGVCVIAHIVCAPICVKSRTLPRRIRK